MMYIILRDNSKGNPPPIFSTYMTALLLML